MIKRILSKIANYNFFILVVAFILLALPYFNINAIAGGHDGLFHLMRIKTLAEEIKHFNIPFFVSGYRIYGYGSADFLFYPYGTLYLPAFIYIITNNLILSYNLYCMAIIFFMIFNTYNAVNIMLKNDKIAIFTTIFYVLNYYMIWNFHIRYAIGECVALAFLPLVVAGIYNLFYDDKKKWWLIIVGLTVIAESHLITFIFIIFAIIVFGLINIKKFIKDNDIRRKVLYSSIIFILLNVGFYYPFFRAYLNEPINISATFGNVIDLRSVISAFWKVPFAMVENSEYNFQAFDTTIINNRYNAFSFVELVLFVITIVYFGSEILRTKCDKNNKKTWYKEKKVAFVCFLIFIFYLIAYTGIVRFLPINFIKELYLKQQFNFRELGRGLIFLSISVAFVLYRFAMYISRASLDNKVTNDNVLSFPTVKKNIDRFCSIICILFMIIMYVSGFKCITRQIFSNDKSHHILRIGDGVVDNKKTDWILNVGTDYIPTKNDYIPSNVKREIKANNDIILTKVKIGYLNAVCDFNKNKYSGTKLYFPFFYYSGYEAFVNDKKVDIMHNENGLIYVELGGVLQGKVEVHYRKPIDYVLVFYVSFISYIILVGYIIYKGIFNK